MFKFLSILIGVSLLSGCAAGLGEEFSCNKVGGVKGCTSMNEIRDNIDTYQAPSSTFPSDHESNLKPPSISFIELPRRNRYGHPQRTHEDVKKITIFPFKTTAEKHYVDTLDIYFVLDESQWTGRPAQAIMKD